MTELQIRWSNPKPHESDFDFSDWSDEQLDKGLKNIIGQLRFEKASSFFAIAVSYIFYVFVTFGIVGLLVFGTKQLFNF